MIENRYRHIAKDKKILPFFNADLSVFKILNLLLEHCLQPNSRRQWVQYIPGSISGDRVRTKTS